MKAKLPEYFGILPKAKLDRAARRGVPRTAGRRRSTTCAATPDGSRPGIFYAHLSDMNAMPTYQLENIAYHEGLPGHHMQISIQQELTGIPKFRTQYGYGAYSEGWGLYSEALAKEMGFDVDPYNDFGRLSRRDLARDPAGGRHRHPRERLDTAAGRRLLQGQLGAAGAGDQVRGRALHPQPGPGDQLQDRHDHDPEAARRGEGRAGRQVRLSAPSTTRCSAAARCRCRCWRPRCAAGSKRRPEDQLRSFCIALVQIASSHS